MSIKDRIKHIDFYCYNCNSDLSKQTGFRKGLPVWICTECKELIVFNPVAVDIQFSSDVVRIINHKMQT